MGAVSFWGLENQYELEGNLKLTKYKVFSKEALLSAAIDGVKMGYPRVIDDVKALEADIDASGLDAFPITFSMPRNRIAGEQVEPYASVKVNLGASGDVSLGVDMETYDLLPVIDIETDDPPPVMFTDYTFK